MITLDFQQDGTPTEQKLPLMEEDVPEDHLIVQNSQHRMSCHSTTGDFSITKDRLRLVCFNLFKLFCFILFEWQC